MEQKDFRLYPRPSFLEGVARLVDFVGILSRYNVSRSPDEADAKALESDWEATGNDIRRAADSAKKKQPKPNGRK